MIRALWVASLVGGMCAFLSAYLMLKGWSLIGDALAHSVVPGVAGAYMLGLPLAAGAFLSGGLATLAMLFIRQRTGLRIDAVIGLIFTSFFALGLFLVSLDPASVNVQSIILGNVLTITPYDAVQLIIISVLVLGFLLLRWRDLMVTFFDENHARTVGLHTMRLQVIFFILLSAATVAALQTVGAFLVIALVITPGATAYLFTDRFGILLMLSMIFGVVTCFMGTYISYFLDGMTGGVIVLLQSVLFLLAFCFAPRRGHCA
ncbi:MAG: metal ABC transporter permease [Pseudomonadota bacterium]